MMNLIYIHTHDSGTMTGAYGYGDESSTLKDFAKDALLFRKAFTTSPTCSPSRASLLTGLYPHENGMMGLANRGFKINDYDDHLVNILKENGYHTVLSGIQHESSRYTNHEEGARVIGYNENISVPFDMSDESLLSKWDQLNTKRTVDYLKNYNKKKPLFLSFGLFSTHRPFPIVNDNKVDERYVTPPQFLPDDKDVRADYSNYLESLAIADACFGEVLQAIKDAGFYDNSIIVFTTDHGIAMPFAKCNLFDQGIGVSFIMRVPTMTNFGEVTESLVSQIDFVPTLVELLNLKTDKTFSGISFAKLFEDENLEIRDDIFTSINFHTSYEPIRSIRTQRYKYIKYFDATYRRPNLSNIDSSKTKDFYLNHDLEMREKSEEYLFDLVYDPTERNNLASHEKYESILKSMRLRLKDYMEKTQDPLLKGPIEIKKEWKVNKQSSRVASSKNSEDYITVK